MEETGRNSAAGGSTERPASSARGIVDKALVKEALGELLQEIPAFREFSARRGSTGQRQVQQGLASTSANAATAVDTTRTTTATVTQAGGGKSVAMAGPWE